MSLTPKREWKRYDPEPPKFNWFGDFHDWEVQVWFITVVLAVILIATIIANVGSSAHGKGSVHRRAPVVRER